MKNICNAIGYLPPEFITREMVEAAAKEHEPRLLDILPKQFITAEIVDEVFSEEKSYYYDNFDLSKIPVEYRTVKVYERAVKSSEKNIVHVPTENITKELVKYRVGGSNMLNWIHLIPSSIWDVELVNKGIWGLLSEKNDSYRYSSRNQAESERDERYMKVQIFLHSIPARIKTWSFYHNLFTATTDLDFISFITPQRYKDQRFYMTMATKNIGLVDSRFWSKELFLEALSENSKVRVSDLLNYEAREEFLWKILDDDLADTIVTKDEDYFHNLPKEFQTEERLILILRMLGARDRHRRYTSYYYPEELLTLRVVKEFIKNGIECEIPTNLWDEKLAAFCLEYGTGDFFWFKQMPQKYQNKDNALAAITDSVHNLQYALKKYIPRDIAIKTMRARCADRYDRCNILNHLPMSYFTEFTRKTGLPYQCLGGEVTFNELKSRHDKFTYCRLGNLFIGFVAEGLSRDPKYKLIITKVQGGNKPVEINESFVSTFHKTWIEKVIAENDPDFIKPKVDANLKDVQALSYYGVEFLEKNVDGFDIYRNTFMGETVGYCVKKDEITYHDDTIADSISGWHYKVNSEKENGQSSAAGFDPDTVFTADMLHRRYGFCETGMGAFCEDYGLDYHGRYSIGQLRQIIHLQGRKSSTFRYQKELKRIKVIA